MRKRPLSLTLIGWIYALPAPVLALLGRAWLDDWPVFGPRGVITHTSRFEWLLMLCMPVVGIGILRVSRWGYVSFLLFSSFLVFHHARLYLSEPSFGLYAGLLGLGFTFGVAGYFLQKHVAAPFFNPGLRWWQRAPRYAVNLAAQARVRHDTYSCVIRDISIGGCFIESDEPVASGDVAWLRVQLGEFAFTALGKVVWVNLRGLRGMGVQFVGMGREDRKTLKRMIEYLSASHAVGLKVNDGVPQDRRSA